MCPAPSRQPSAAVAPTETLSGLINEYTRAANNQSVFLAKLSRPEDALAAIEEAVTIRRQLAATRPQIYTAQLASSLRMGRPSSRGWARTPRQLKSRLKLRS